VPLIPPLAAAAAYVGAASPWVGQRVPRFFFPTLAVVAAAFMLRSFVNALLRMFNRDRTDARRPVLSLLLNTVGVVVLVILPATHFVRMLSAPPDGAAHVLVGFGDWLGDEGYPLPNRIAGSTWPVASAVTCWRRPMGASCWRGIMATCAASS
jgi:branched-subunit amino acid ABC-type transport system permease component